VATVFEEIKSRTFQGLPSTSRPFSKPIPSNTDVHYIAYSSPTTASFFV